MLPRSQFKRQSLTIFTASIFSWQKQLPLVKDHYKEYLDNANTITAQRILNRTYTFPEDFNQATKEIYKECAHIRLMVPKDSLNITIMKDDLKRQWKGQRESTLSFESALHFGCYIVGCNSNHITYFHVLKLTLVIKREIVLD
jgi:hypothetical protein